MGTPVSSALSSEAAGFLQRRVRGFALLVSAIFGAFLALRLAVGLLTIQRAPLGPSPLDLPFHAAGVLSTVALWWYCRGPQRSPRALRRAEVAAIIFGTTMIQLMGLYLPVFIQPEHIVWPSTAFIIMIRAVFVPCRARTTALLGVAVGLPLLGGVFLHVARDWDPTIFSASAPLSLRDSVLAEATRATIITAAWYAAAVVIASATSQVIYGLRREVSNARRLGQYTLGARLGAGGMGEVYRASHALLRRPTAVKLLPPDKIGADSLARFEREVQLTAQLSHPNTVRIYDYGHTADGIFYYAMELLDGANLAQIVSQTGAMPAARVIAILDQAAGALGEAHAVGLIHRDVKPANILLVDQGGEPDVAKVVDFGLVKDLGEDAGLTQDGFAGTPQYMAPEAISAPGEVDPRADLYALGAVGYFLVTGHDVFAGKTVVEVCSHHLHSQPVTPSARLGRPVPADLERLLLDCLAKDPARRPASARALRERLAACADAGTWREADARAFWAGPGRDLRARPAAAGAVGGASTMAVDLGTRCGDLAGTTALVSADTIEVGAGGGAA